MPARAIGSGTIAFGLVSIPVKLFNTAMPSAGVSFHQLHRDCGSRLKQQLYCPKDEVVVSRNEVAKGFEFAKGQHVVLSEEELKAVAEQATGDIDITEFVPLAEVDPVFYDKAYYLGPDKGAGRAYQLLARAMRDSGLSAVAKYAARGKQYLVLLRPIDDGIVLQQLHHADEVRPFSEVPVDDAKIKDGELDLAMELIKRATHKSFKPEKYRDEVKERVEAIIKRKVEGEEITAEPQESPRAQVIDLMTALKASLGEGGLDSASNDAGTEKTAKSSRSKGASPRKGPKPAQRDDEPAAPKRSRRDSSKR